MKQTFLFLLLFACTFPLFGQEEVQVPIIAYWAKNDTLRYKITKVQKHKSNAEITKYDSTSYNATLIVTDSTQNSYKIKWLMEGYFSTNKDLPEVDTKILRKFNVEEIHYKINELGEFQEITNWKEFSKLMKLIFNELAKKDNSMDGVNKKKFENAMKSASRLFSTRESIESNIFPEIQSLHFPFGYQLSTTEVIEGEGFLPSLFSDEMMRVNEKIYLRQLDYEDEYCTFIYELKVNQEDAKREIIKYLKSLNPESSLEESINTYNLEIDDYNVFNLYYYPGIVTKSDLNRFVKVETGQSTHEIHKRLIIELISE